MQTPVIEFSPPLPRWLIALLFCGALAAALWRAPVVERLEFAAPGTATAANLATGFSSEMLPQAAAAARTASLTALPDGRIAAAWSAGSAEDADDFKIRFSILGADGWSAPKIIASVESTAAGTFAHTLSVGRPVLYAEGSWLHLWYSSRENWLGSSINHSVSNDKGATWYKPTKLQTSPFANSGSELAGPPLPLADGGLVLPLQQQLIAGHDEWLRLGPTGKILDKIRLTDNKGMLQASGIALPITNPTASLALLHLKSGRLLLAGNTQEGRGSLGLWHSTDAGKTWIVGPIIETAADGAAEFIDPALVQARDGKIHLAYTWRRQGIKHAVFSEAWLDGATP